MANLYMIIWALFQLANRIQILKFPTKKKNEIGIIPISIKSVVFELFASKRDPTSPTRAAIYATRTPSKSVYMKTNVLKETK